MLSRIVKEVKGSLSGRTWLVDEPVIVAEAGETEGHPWLEILSGDGDRDLVDPDAVAVPWDDMERPVDEVAKYLGIPKSTLSRACTEGRVMNRKIRRDVVTTAAAVRWAVLTGSLRGTRIKTDKDHLVDLLLGAQKGNANLSDVVFRAGLWKDERGNERVGIAKGVMMAVGIEWDVDERRWEKKGK